jgi:Mg-chelatase subunit ChlD
MRPPTSPLIALAVLVPSVLAAAPPAARPTGPPAPTASVRRGPRLEVAFVIDATGSMDPYIAEVRTRIRAIAEELATGDPPPQVRFALVAFRDRGDDYVTKVAPFGTLDAVKTALAGTEAGGGGDTPEAVVLGLRDAVETLDWTDRDREVLKLIYLVGDAPDKAYADAPSAASIAAAAVRRGIAIHTIACGSMDDDGERTFDLVARHTEGRSFRLGGLRGAVAAATGARATADLAGTVASSAKAYSTSVGVSYGGASGAPPLSISSLATPAVARSGLLGAEVRWIRDPAAWTDLWAAHVSLTPSATAPPPPPIDFAVEHFLVVGGADAGLAVERIDATPDGRIATIRPVAATGPSFVRVAIGGGK